MAGLQERKKRQWPASSKDTFLTFPFLYPLAKASPLPPQRLAEGKEGRKERRRERDMARRKEFRNLSTAWLS